MKTLDDKDYEILSILQGEGRITNTELATRVQLSPPSVLQRVRQLERSGYITGYFAHLDAEMLGLKIKVLALISMSLHQEQSLEKLIASFREIPEVIECHHVSGEFDFLLKIVVEDMRCYEALLREKILRIKGVGQIRSSFVLGSFKESSILPI